MRRRPGVINVTQWFLSAARHAATKSGAFILPMRRSDLLPRCGDLYTATRHATSLQKPKNTAGPPSEIRDHIYSAGENVIRLKVSHIFRSQGIILPFCYPFHSPKSNT